MSQVGRPRVLDEGKQREICALLSVGCGIERAAHYVGCAPSTIRRESMRNELFHERVRSAEMAAQLEPMQAIRKAASSNWRAAAWLLERTQPERFAPQDVRLFRPEEVEALFDQLIERICEHVADDATRQRVYHELQAELRHQMAEKRGGLQTATRSGTRAETLEEWLGHAGRGSVMLGVYCGHH